MTAIEHTDPGHAGDVHQRRHPGGPPVTTDQPDVWLRPKTSPLGAPAGPVFRSFRPEIDPGTPLDRRGSPGTSICTKNQPRRPILRPFLKKIPKRTKKIKKKPFKSL